MISLEGLSILESIGAGGLEITDNEALGDCTAEAFAAGLEVEGTVLIYGNGDCD